jgi:RNA polymerase sigma-70 factor (ECF subfamily)
MTVTSDRGAGVTAADRPSERLEALYRGHADALLLYAQARLPLADAEDAVAEAFAVASRRIADIPDRALPWLLGVLRHVIGNTYQARTSRARLLGRLVPQWAPAFPDHAEAVAEAELAARALSRLRPGDREVIQLLMAGDLTPAEMGELLGCTPGAAAVRVHRARRRLRAAFAAEDAAVDAVPNERPQP